jgi:hypothetical protein
MPTKKTLRKIPEVVSQLNEESVACFIEDKVGSLKGLPKRVKSNLSVISDQGKILISKGDEPLLKKLIASKSSEPAKKSLKRKQPEKEPLVDLWSKPVKLGASAKKRMALNTVVPVIPLPHSGQSANPKLEDFVALAETVLAKSGKADSEVKSTVESSSDPQNVSVKFMAPEFQPGHLKTRKSKAERNKEARHEKLMAQHAQEREAKHIEKQINNLGTIQKDLTKENSEFSLRQQQEEQLKKEKLEKYALGLEAPERGPGGRYQEVQPEISLEGIQSGGSLRRVSPGNFDPIADRMQSIYRRRLLEQPAKLDADYLNRLKFRKHKKSIRKLHSRDARDIALMR